MTLYSTISNASVVITFVVFFLRISLHPDDVLFGCLDTYRDLLAAF